MEKLDYLIDYLLKESERTDFDYSNRDKNQYISISKYKTSQTYFRRFYTSRK